VGTSEALPYEASDRRAWQGRPTPACLYVGADPHRRRAGEGRALPGPTGVASWGGSEDPRPHFCEASLKTRGHMPMGGS